MVSRPDTARSEISSAISEDGLPPLPPPSDRARSTIPAGPTSPHGYTHFRGVTHPTNRSLRSPPPPSTTSGASRPQSPESTTSRTHVPSLTAQGFLRPMSSSRLQQQRLESLKAARAARSQQQRPQTGVTNATIDDDAQSMRSNRTGPYASLPPMHRPTASITTGYTESEVPNDYDVNSQPTQSETGDYFRSESPPKRTFPAPLNLSNSLSVADNKDKPMRSPHSFRSGFSIGSKQIIPPTHQSLHSNEPSPRYNEHARNTQEKQYLAQQSALGKNYEYFEGNNVFWLGGRLQNARDRPMNIATGILLVLPAVLFFVFS